MFQNRFDELYLTICKEVGGIQGLLKSFFDFMIRKTDFFYECDPGDKMGFPPGYNKKLLLGIFEQFQQQHYKRFPKKSSQEFNKKLQAFKQKQQQKKNSQAKSSSTENKNTEKAITVSQKSSTSKNQTQIPTQKLDTELQEIRSIVNPTNVDLISTYNGGKNQKYSWSQQTREVQVTIEIDPQIKAKQLKVKMETKYISVKDKNSNIIIEGQLYEKINTSESVWKVQSIKGKNYLNFNLEKAQQKIWNTVFIGDAEIDTTKVNNSKKLDEFDEQTQGAIRKIMYEQQRKLQGLPTTEQEKQQEALKKAWNAEGSPFKGTPFDPSKLNLSGFKP